MSETTKKTAQERSGEELVSFTAPYDPAGTSRDIILGVNGEIIRIKRGSTVKIKKKFLEVWEHSNQQVREAHQVMERAQEGAKAPMMEM